MRYYEVWGWDTFAGEEYFCGRYNTRKEAVKELLKKEKGVEKTQDESIRDTYSILEVTDDEIEKREKEENRICREKMAERSFNPKHLTECVRELLGLFKDAWENIDPAELSKNEEEKRTLTQEVECRDEKNCFSRITLDTFYNNGWIIVGIRVSVRSGEYYHGGNIKNSCVYINSLQEMLQWVDTREAVEDCSDKIKELIMPFTRINDITQKEKYGKIKYKKLFWQTIAGILTTCILVFTLAFCYIFYEKELNDERFYTSDYYDTELTSHIWYHNSDDNGQGYIFNCETGEKTLKGVSWIALSEDGDEFAVFSTGRKRGYFNIYTGKAVIPAQYTKAWYSRKVSLPYRKMTAYFL